MKTQTSPKLGTLSQIAQNLYATDSAPLPFMKNAVVRSYILKSSDDLTIMYNSAGIDVGAEDILRLGIPGRLLVNHWHEAMYGRPQKISLPVFSSDADRERIGSDLPIADVFSNLNDIGGIEVVPLPGHTLGATAFLWTDGGCRYLFSGDSVWIHNGRWEAVVIGESDRRLYLQSMEILAELEFDVLVPWVSLQGSPFTDSADRQKIQMEIGGIIARLRKGENG